jgi:hypothetical protein
LEVKFLTVKIGVLKRNTFIYTSANITLKFPKQTKVIVENGELTFNPVDGVKAVKLQGKFLICLWDAWYLVEFPKGGIPYPFSML